jgi:RNA polymerase sigma-70 factor (ECF subfamily)
MGGPDQLPHCKGELPSKCDDFVTLLSRHSRRIYGYIRTMVIDFADANDVFQNTTICLWKKFDEFTIGTNFFAWSCQVAYLEVLKFRERKRPQLALSEEVLDLMATEAVDRADELASREAALSECLKKLSPEDRKLLEQRYYKDRKPKEIARRRSRSVFSIYRALSRIHDQLFDCINRALAENRSP